MQRGVFPYPGTVWKNSYSEHELGLVKFKKIKVHAHIEVSGYTFHESRLLETKPFMYTKGHRKVIILKLVHPLDNVAFDQM